MTKLIAHNEKMLDIAMADMYRQFKEYGCLRIEYEKPFKDKTKRQLGFFWGAIVDSIQDFFRQQGIDYSQDEIKNNFYQAIAPPKGYNAIQRKAIRDLETYKRNVRRGNVRVYRQVNMAL